jgi:tetratricopeptide (TPR) repeat protein
MAHSCLGSTFVLSGEPEKAITPLLVSIRLNPYDPYCFHYLGELAIAFHMQGQWKQACEFASRSLELRQNYWYAKAIRIASLARSGAIEKARELAAEDNLSFSHEQINWLPFIDKKWNDLLREGLELAGCTVTGGGGGKSA